MSRIIREASDLAPGKPILIYGAGERGSKFARALRLAGHVCQGFLDSFKAGEQDSLPVYHYPDVPEGLFENCRVVVASCKHTAIANILSMDGHGTFHILADEGETLDYVFLAEDAAETVEMLSSMSRSLVHSVSERQPKPGCRWTCTYLDQGDDMMADTVKRIIFDGYDHEIYIDLHGTEFQLKVWKEVMKVQKGETISYQELAERIGEPKAVRAVAAAVAQNSIAMLVPCHRIIHKDGTLGEYHWGRELKKEILDWEKNTDA